MEYNCLVMAQRTRVWRLCFKTRVWDPHFVFQGATELNSNPNGTGSSIRVYQQLEPYYTRQRGN
jgi:hypothetical protein